MLKIGIERFWRRYYIEEGLVDVEKFSKGNIQSSKYQNLDLHRLMVYGIENWQYWMYHIGNSRNIDILSAVLAIFVAIYMFYIVLETSKSNIVFTICLGWYIISYAIFIYLYARTCVLFITSWYPPIWELSIIYSLLCNTPKLEFPMMLSTTPIRILNFYFLFVFNQWFLPQNTSFYFVELMEYV